MIKEWLLRQILRNRIVLFDNNNEFVVINDIYFDDWFKFVEFDFLEVKELKK